MTAGEAPVPVLRVRNTGTEPLEPNLEPYGSDHCSLRPDGTFVIRPPARPVPTEAVVAL